MDDDLLLIGEAQSVLTDECDSEGDAVHGLFPTRPVNKFILSLQKYNRRSNKICFRFIFINQQLSFIHYRFDLNSKFADLELLFAKCATQTTSVSSAPFNGSQRNRCNINIYGIKKSI